MTFIPHKRDGDLASLELASVQEYKPVHSDQACNSNHWEIVLNLLNVGHHLKSCFWKLRGQCARK